MLTYKAAAILPTGIRLSDCEDGDLSPASRHTMRVEQRRASKKPNYSHACRTRVQPLRANQIYLRVQMSGNPFVGVPL